MPSNEEIIQDAETLFHLVVHFPDEEEGDEIDCGIEPPLAEFSAEDAEGHGLPSKRKSSEGALPPSITEAKRPRQHSDDGCENSSVGLPGGPRVASATTACSSSDLPNMELLRCQSITEDAVDGSHSSLPTETKSEKDHNQEIIKKVAGKLRYVADDFNMQYTGKGNASASSISVSLASETVEKLVANLTYDNFKEAVIKASGEDPGLQQLVCVFRLASAIANKAQKSSEAQNNVSACYMRYFTNNLAGWVNSVGGWGGVLELL